MSASWGNGQNVNSQWWLALVQFDHKIQSEQKESFIIDEKFWN